MLKIINHIVNTVFLEKLLSSSKKNLNAKINNINLIKPKLRVRLSKLFPTNIEFNNNKIHIMISEL